MIGTSGGVFRFPDRLRREVVAHALDLAGLLQMFPNVIPFSIHGRINLVGHFAVPLVLFKAYVVRAGSDPHCSPVPSEWRLPDTAVMTAGNNGVGLRLLVAKILWSIEQVQRAHRHSQIVFIFVGLYDCAHHRDLCGLIGELPMGGAERRLQFLLSANDYEIHHVAQVLELVAYTSRNTIQVFCQYWTKDSVGHLEGRLR